MNWLRPGKLAAWFFLVLAGVVLLGCDQPVAMKPDVPTGFSESCGPWRTWTIDRVRRANWS